MKKVIAPLCLGLALISNPANAQGFIYFGGGAHIMLNGGYTRGHVQLQGGVEVGNDLFLSFTPMLAFGGSSIAELPLGIEYNAHFSRAPRLSIVPRLSGGAAIFFGGGSSSWAGLVEPALGIKYRVAGPWTLGIEPLCFPIYIADSAGLPNAAYRFTGFTGFDL